MEVLSQRCGGLDVHQRTVVACLRLHEGKGEARKELRTFETVTAALLILSDWLTAQGVTHVARVRRAAWKDLKPSMGQVMRFTPR